MSYDVLLEGRFTTEDVRAAKRLLAAHGASDSGDLWHLVELPDGGRLEIELHDRAAGHGWGVNFLSFSGRAIQLVHALMAAGNFAIRRGGREIVASAEARRRAKEPSVVFARSGSELRALLAPTPKS